MSIDAISRLVAALAMIFISIVILAIFLRWMFRINKIVEELEKITKEMEQANYRIAKLQQAFDERNKEPLRK